MYDIEGDLTDEQRARIAEVISTSGWGLLEMYSSRLSLEDIFLKLTDTERNSRQRATELGRPVAAKESRREK